MRLSMIAATPILMAFGLTAFWGCGKEEVKAVERPPAEVAVVKVEAKDIPVNFTYVAQT